jgi:ABC-type multidrug transport system fused ATPase/permease subunit
MIEVQRSLRQRLLAVLLQQESLWFDRKGNHAAEVASRLSADCRAAAHLISVNLHTVLHNALQAVGGLTYLVFVNARLASVTGAMMLVLCFISLRCAPSGPYFSACLYLYHWLGQGENRRHCAGLCMVAV